MTKRDELRKLAEAADLNIDWIGAGPTRHGDLISTSGKPLFIDSVYLDCDEQDVDGDDYFVCSAGSDEYGRFIAAASPRTVIGLLDDLKAAEQQRDELIAGMFAEEPLRRQLNELQDEVDYHRTDAKKWALQALKFDKWKPIETAPKDGRYLMVGNEDGVWVACYTPTFQSGFQPDNPWISLMLNHRHIKKVKRNYSSVPTHWMPLPTPPKVGARPTTENEMELTFEDALRIARGCTDYGGGHRGNAEHYEIYQHGIQTVINSLTAASNRGLEDTQVAALHVMGANAKVSGVPPQD